MRRLPLALAFALAAVTASLASAQNPYGYAPNAMTPGGTPPGIFPGAAQYHAKIPAPPKPKLPRGVDDDGGLLFYNGRAYQDGNNPYAQQQYAAQMAAYQEAVGGAPGEMTPAQQYAANASQGCDNGCCDCGQCDGCCNDPYCSGCCGRPGIFHGLFAWLHGDGRGFPGKMGSVWSAGAELVYYKREHNPDYGLVLNTNNNNDTLLSAQQLSYVYEPGFRTWLSYMGPSGIAAQFIFLQVNDMEAAASVSGDNDLQIPFPLAASGPSFFGADRMTLRDFTNFSSFEANVVYPWSSIQFLAGFRYVQVAEEASITARDIDASGLGFYHVDCINRLYGAQIGVLGQYEAFGIVNFDFAAKTGLYGNASFQHQIVTDSQNPIETIRDTSGTDDDVAYVSELNARAVFPLGPTFSIQAGYDVIFINRVALATQQFDFDVNDTAGTFVRGGRNLIIHGISGGLTAKW